MDPVKLAMLAAAAGLYKLSPEATALLNTDAFWDELEATPEDSLTPIQRRVLGEMGVNLDATVEEDEEDEADEEDDDDE